MTTRISGREAIEYVESLIAAHDWAQGEEPTLSKYADPVEDWRDDLTPEEAREVAQEDPALIYYDRLP
jgi:hypothetical protein